MSLKLEAADPDSLLKQSSATDDKPIYRSAVLFQQSETFSTAEAFFAASRERLLADCGYEARPSKQKPTKVTARCERHAEGCPFRLCAFLFTNGRNSAWNVTVGLCIWDHSHPPRSPVVPAPALKLPAPTALPPAPVPPAPATVPASPSPAAARTAVLFKREARFASAADFTAKTTARSNQIYEVSCHAYNHGTTRSTVRIRCPYKLCAQARDGSWILDWERCAWTHNHERGSKEALPPDDAEPPVLEASQPDPPGPSETASQVAPSPASQQPALSRQAPRRRATSPKFRDRFRSLDEAYVATAVATVVNIGTSSYKLPSGGATAQGQLAGSIYCNQHNACDCPYRIAVGPDTTGKAAVVTRSSVLVHNHGPNEKMQTDPCWRPKIHNARLRAGLARWDAGLNPLELPPLTPEPEGDPSGQPPAKRARYDLPAGPIPASATPAAPTPTPPVVSAPVAAAPPPPPAVPVPVPAARPPSALPSPRLPTPSTPTVSAPEFAPIPSFLAGLDLSLVPLAPHLVAAGIDSHDTLVGFLSFSAGIRRALLEELERVVQPAERGGVSFLRLLEYLP
ncbi:hypothetical protein JCM8202v2_001707 [Rhodotorula sphaerocarpa]